MGCGSYILKLDNNYGYAGGNNRGFNSINNDKPDYVIFLNNDTIVDKDFINPLIKPLLRSISISCKKLNVLEEDISSI